MESRRWGGDGATFAREHSLIALGVEAVFFVALDVRRQRRAADAIDDFVKVTRGFKSNHSAAVLAPFDHFSSEFAPGEFNSRARQQGSAGSNQRFPYQRFLAAHKKDLDAPAQHRIASRRYPNAPANKPRWKDSRVVEDKQVARAK